MVGGQEPHDVHVELYGDTGGIHVRAVPVRVPDGAAGAGHQRLGGAPDRRSGGPPGGERGVQAPRDHRRPGRSVRLRRGDRGAAPRRQHRDLRGDRVSVLPDQQQLAAQLRRVRRQEHPDDQRHELSEADRQHGRAGQRWGLEDPQRRIPRDRGAGHDERRRQARLRLRPAHQRRQLDPGGPQRDRVRHPRRAGHPAGQRWWRRPRGATGEPRLLPRQRRQRTPGARPAGQRHTPHPRRDRAAHHTDPSQRGDIVGVVAAAGGDRSGRRRDPGGRVRGCRVQLDRLCRRHLGSGVLARCRLAQ